VDTAQLIEDLQGHIDRVLRPLLSNAERIALLDFPNHSNIGDSAIWLGELAYLRSSAFGRIAYTCSTSSYSATQLSEAVGDGLILLSGGGNFGDLWKRHQLLREQVILDFPGNPIIQLPQSICFQNTANIERAKSVINRHNNLTLLVRDHNSLSIARDEFIRPVLLCPDMAFSLGPLDRPREPSERIFWLARTDKETRGEEFTFGGNGVKARDWIEEDRAAAGFLNHLQGSFPAAGQRIWQIFKPAQSLTDERLATEQVKRGCDLLAQGRFVVTDRLHGHILCLLMGIPHIVLDNSYGKVSSFYSTWTKDCDDSAMCNSFSEAFEKIKSRI